MNQASQTEQRYPEPTVGALILNQQDQLLLVKTHKWKGNFTIPGGHVEVGETLNEALRREILEETGLELLRADYLCFQEFIHDPSFWEPRHYIFFDFVCRVGEGSVVLNAEAQDYAWVDLNEVEGYPVDGYLLHALSQLAERPDLLVSAPRSTTSEN